MYGYIHKEIYTKSFMNIFSCYDFDFSRTFPSSVTFNPLLIYLMAVNWSAQSVELVSRRTIPDPASAILSALFCGCLGSFFGPCCASFRHRFHVYFTVSKVDGSTSRASPPLRVCINSCRITLSRSDITSMGLDNVSIFTSLLLRAL